MPTVLIISSSPSEKSKTAAVAQHVTDRLSAMGMGARHLRLRDLPPEALMRADTKEPAVSRQPHSSNRLMASYWSRRRTRRRTRAC